MPPKKAPAKANAQDAAVEEKARKLADLQRQCDATSRMMVVCSEQVQRSRLESLNLKKKIAELNSKFDEQQKFTDERCSGMYKLYRSGQSQLQARIETNKSAIDELRQQLESGREQLELIKAERDAEIAEKTRRINEQRQKMEEMAVAFGIRLKETLERMSMHIHGRV